MGSLLFALGVQPLYQEIQTKFPSIKLAAFYDDLTMVGPPSDLVTATHQLIRLAMDNYGLKVEPTKCNFIYFHQQTSPLTSELEQQITTTLGIPLQFDAAEILGCPIAKDKELLQLKAKETAHKLKLNRIKY